jgi:hypothetical protein
MTPKKKFEGTKTTSDSKVKVFNPINVLLFPGAKNHVIETLYPRYSIKAVVLKGILNSHLKMAGYIRIKTGDELTKFCLDNKKNNRLLTIAIKYLKTRYRIINRKNTK